MAINARSKPVNECTHIHTREKRGPGQHLRGLANHGNLVKRDPSRPIDWKNATLKARPPVQTHFDADIYPMPHVSKELVHMHTRHSRTLVLGARHQYRLGVQINERRMQGQAATEQPEGQSGATLTTHGQRDYRLTEGSASPTHTSTCSQDV